MRAPRPGFPRAIAAAVAVMAFAPAAAAQVPPSPTPLDRTAFEESTEIDNPWFPLHPGTQFVLEGSADRGDGLRPHRVVFTVTGVSKVVDGVRTLVVWDRDFHDGELVEEEIHFHAQDDVGNVWSFGEYPEEYEQGRFIGAPATWLSGVADALAGTHMLGDPRAGSPPYVQGIAPAIDFFNAARVLATGRSTCIPRACYDDVLVTDEFSPLEPEKGSVHKHYARGVGNIRVEPAGDPEAETLVQADLIHLDEHALAEANARTLALDARAYEVAADVYRDSAPARLLGDDDDDEEPRD